MRYLLPYRGKVALATVMIALSTFCNLMLPTIMSDIVNNGVYHADFPYIIRCCAEMLAVAACVAILWVLAPYIRGLLDFCGQLASRAGLDGQLLLPVCKVMGIAVCCRITAEVCRDNGQKALAAQVELGGAVCGLLCALPLLQRALELIGAL